MSLRNLMRDQSFARGAALSIEGYEYWNFGSQVQEVSLASNCAGRHRHFSMKQKFKAKPLILP